MLSAWMSVANWRESRERELIRARSRVLAQKVREDASAGRQQLPVLARLAECAGGLAGYGAAHRSVAPAAPASDGSPSQSFRGGVYADGALPEPIQPAFGQSADGHRRGPKLGRKLSFGGIQSYSMLRINPKKVRGACELVSSGMLSCCYCKNGRAKSEL